MRNASKILIVVAAALAVGACANSEQASTEPPGDSISVPPPSTSESEPPEESSPAPGDQETAVECTADDIVVSGEPNAKPAVTLPTTCSPPTELLIADLVPGDGPEAVEGSNLQANYLLITWSNGQELDTSWKAEGAQPLPLENLGQAQVIDGWNQGLPGIRQGGRRLLVVPPELGYGEAGQDPVQPNETLVFVVDAVEVTGP